MQFLDKKVALLEVNPSKITHKLNRKPRNTEDIIIPIVTIRLLFQLGSYYETMVFRADSETLYEEPILYCNRTGLILSDLWHLKNLDSKSDVEKLQARFSNLFDTTPSLSDLKALKTWLDNHTPILSDFVETDPKKYVYYTQSPQLKPKTYDELSLDDTVTAVINK